MPRQDAFLPTIIPWHQALVKYSALVNGFDSLNITKLDVLTGLKQIRVAIAYRLGSFNAMMRREGTWDTHSLN